MSSEAKAIVSKHALGIGSRRSYVTGFILSIVFTLTAYILVVNHALTDRTLTVLIIMLALVQFLVQLIFFLHLGSETKPRWRLLVFTLMVSVVAILVGGSLWIMNNLNTRMMASPSEMESYMKSQDGF